MCSSDLKSFNVVVWRGILEFYGDTWKNQKNRGQLYDVVACQTRDMYIPNLKQAADKGYDLIITTGFTFAEAGSSDLSSVLELAGKFFSSLLTAPEGTAARAPCQRLVLSSEYTYHAFGKQRHRIIFRDFFDFSTYRRRIPKYRAKLPQIGRAHV